MGSAKTQYHQLTIEELNRTWEKQRDYIYTFLSSNDYNHENIIINQDIILSIIVKVDQRRQYFQFFHGIEMSRLKECALFCFWYIKLRPISVNSRIFNSSQSGNYSSINEKLALFLILSTIRSELREKKLSDAKLDCLPDRYIREVIYSFTYRDISKESMILLVESIAVMLGLDPYSKTTSLRNRRHFRMKRNKNE